MNLVEGIAAVVAAWTGVELPVAHHCQCKP